MRRRSLPAPRPPALLAQDSDAAGAELAVVQNLFEPEQLRRLQASWRRAQGPARQLWHEAKEFGEGQFEGNGEPSPLCCLASPLVY